MDWTAPQELMKTNIFPRCFLLISIIYFIDSHIDPLIENKSEQVDKREVMMTLCGSGPFQNFSPFFQHNSPSREKVCY